MEGKGVAVGVPVGDGVIVSVAVALGKGEAEGKAVTVAVGTVAGAAQAVSRIIKREMKVLFFMGNLLSGELYPPSRLLPIFGKRALWKLP